MAKRDDQLVAKIIAALTPQQLDSQSLLAMLLLISF